MTGTSNRAALALFTLVALTALQCGAFALRSPQAAHRRLGLHRDSRGRRKALGQGGRRKELRGRSKELSAQREISAGWALAAECTLWMIQRTTEI